MKRCPHANVVDCPLYVGMHQVGPSCFPRRHDLFEGCAVDHGEVSYEAKLAELRAFDPRLVAKVEFAAGARASAEQQARNMRWAH